MAPSCKIRARALATSSARSLTGAGHVDGALARYRTTPPWLQRGPQGCAPVRVDVLDGLDARQRTAVVVALLYARTEHASQVARSSAGFKGSRCGHVAKIPTSPSLRSAEMLARRRRAALARRLGPQ